MWKTKASGFSVFKLLKLREKSSFSLKKMEDKLANQIMKQGKSRLTGLHLKCIGRISSDNVNAEIRYWTAAALQTNSLKI